jgi:hypothetical protein
MPIDFAKEIRTFGQRDEPVGKSSRDPEFPKIIVAEFDGHVSTKCRAVDPHIDRDIQNAAAHHADKFACGLGFCRCKPRSTPCEDRDRFVLNERSARAKWTISLHLKMFEEEPSLIYENFWSTTRTSGRSVLMIFI